MIEYDKSKKTLVIPVGLGNFNADHQDIFQSGYTEGFIDGQENQALIDENKLTPITITENADIRLKHYKNHRYGI